MPCSNGPGKFELGKDGMVITRCSNAEQKIAVEAHEGNAQPSQPQPVVVGVQVGVTGKDLWGGVWPIEIRQFQGLCESVDLLEN